MNNKHLLPFFLLLTCLFIFPPKAQAICAPKPFLNPNILVLAEYKGEKPGCIREFTTIAAYKGNIEKTFNTTRYCPTPTNIPNPTSKKITVDFSIQKPLLGDTIPEPEFIKNKLYLLTVYKNQNNEYSLNLSECSGTPVATKVDNASDSKIIRSILTIYLQPFSVLFFWIEYALVLIFFPLRYIPEVLKLITGIIGFLLIGLAIFILYTAIRSLLRKTEIKRKK